MSRSLMKPRMLWLTWQGAMAMIHQTNKAVSYPYHEVVMLQRCKGMCWRIAMLEKPLIVVRLVDGNYSGVRILESRGREETGVLLPLLGRSDGCESRSNTGSIKIKGLGGEVESESRSMDIESEFGKSEIQIRRDSIEVCNNRIKVVMFGGVVETT